MISWEPGVVIRIDEIAGANGFRAAEEFDTKAGEFSAQI
jgi:hypothetical protein